jgi:hypothetical protein
MILKIAIINMKKLVDIVISVGSLWCIYFIASNWDAAGGYGYWTYFSYHWLISICLAIVWIVFFFRNKSSRGTLTYLSISLMVASIVLDCLWLDKAAW